MEGRVQRVPGCFHGLASLPSRASGQQKEMGLAGARPSECWAGEESGDGGEPPPAVLASRLTPDDEGSRERGFPGRRAEQKSKRIVGDKDGNLSGFGTSS